MKNLKGTITLNKNASELLTLMSLSKNTLKQVTEDRYLEYFFFAETCHDFGSWSEQKRMMNKASRLRRKWRVAQVALSNRNSK